MSEGVSVGSSCPPPSLPPELEVKGHLPSTTITTAATTPESLTLMSMSELAGQGREESWLVVSEGDIPTSRVQQIYHN